MNYEPVIGLEVHAQLLTRSKIFCRCRSEYGLEPNSATCPVCLGLPGALPVLNRKAVEFALKMILAVGGTVREKSIFARKNYFYPDLPKGYQISQYDHPIGAGGSIEFDNDGRRIRILLTRIHLEEDAGKSMHPEADDQNYTCIDMNRCGVPLIEIVSEPDIHSPHEAYLYLHRLKQIVEYLRICDGNMEEGSLRCDANVSVRPVGHKEFGTRTEVKNLNSIRGLEKALSFEIDRQIKLIESGQQVVQETLLYNDSDGKCYPMRSKEEADDYRYFPEPDLVPLEISPAWIESINKSLPELPQTRIDRFVNEYQIPVYDAEVLTTTSQLADFYETTVKVTGDPKLTANWVMTEVLRVTKEQKSKIDQFPIRPDRLGTLLTKISSGKITSRIGKELFEIMRTDNRNPDIIIKEKGLTPISKDAELEKLVDRIIAENILQVTEYRNGKTNLIDFFIGQLMKVTQGRANPKTAMKLFKSKLDI